MNSYWREFGELSILIDDEWQSLVFQNGSGKSILALPHSNITGCRLLIANSTVNTQVFDINLKSDTKQSGFLRVETRDLDTFSRVEPAIKELVEKGAARADLTDRRQRAEAEYMVMLTTRTRVPFSEISSILTKYRLSNDADEARRLVEKAILSNRVKGAIDGDSFVSKDAPVTEVVHYQVVANFELSRDGTVKLRCPNCGASVISSKERNQKCEYCGSVFVVPSKILSML